MTSVTDERLPPGEARVLVLGRSQPVLEAVLAELSALGINARGTTAPGRAPDRHNAWDYDLIAFDHGLPDETRQTLKARFRHRNPAVRLLDTTAPLAAYQIVEALRGSARRPAVDLDAYCAQIGYHGPRTPTLETLYALHEHHPAAIPFEAVDVLLDRGVDIAPAAVDDKLLRAGRGGYCFEHALVETFQLPVEKEWRPVIERAASIS